MTVIKWNVRAGTYYDSVVLMQLQRGLLELNGVLDAGVVMATPANKDLLATNNLLPENVSANPDDLLIVVSPRGDMVDVFKLAKDEMIFKIEEKKLKNVLLLEGTEAYQMDHGVFVIDGEVIHEKISVEDALDWLESNR